MISVKRRIKMGVGNFCKTFFEELEKIKFRGKGGQKLPTPQKNAPFRYDLGGCLGFVITLSVCWQINVYVRVQSMSNLAIVALSGEIDTLPTILTRAIH